MTHSLQLMIAHIASLQSVIGIELCLASEIQMKSKKIANIYAQMP
jgi:hypothetical protein